MWLENCNALKGEPKEQDTWWGHEKMKREPIILNPLLGSFFICAL